MYSKIQITGTLEVVTGLHIGGNSAFAAIGAVDAPVIKDRNLPMIPGSTLKGKMRSLLAKEYNEGVVQPDNDTERILRVFGSAKKNNIKPSRILFSDMILSNEDELRKQDIHSMTEVKFENSINRQTDMQLLAEGLKLLQYDYIGGHGSRGYGKVKFNDLQADVVIGEIDDAEMKKINDMFATV